MIFPDHPGPPPQRAPCLHIRLRQVWRILEGRDQTRRYGFQCEECGASGYKAHSGELISQWVGAAKCFDRMGYQPEEAEPYSLAIRLNYCRRYARDRRAAWLEWYQSYLASPAWARMRRRVLSRDQGMCQWCHAPATEIHHFTYERVGYETPEDLIALCRECHQREHGRAE